MKQRIAYSGFPSAPLRVAGLSELATEYFAYTAFVAAAVGVTVVTLAFSANFAMTVLVSALLPGPSQAEQLSAAGAKAVAVDAQWANPRPFAMMDQMVPGRSTF